MLVGIVGLERSRGIGRKYGGGSACMGSGREHVYV